MRDPAIEGSIALCPATTERRRARSCSAECCLRRFANRFIDPS